MSYGDLMDDFGTVCVVCALHPRRPAEQSPKNKEDNYEKRILAAMLGLAMACGLIACSSSDSGEGSVSEETNETENEETEGDEEDITEGNIEEDLSETTMLFDASFNNSSVLKMNTDATIEETILYDVDGIVITANEIVYDVESDSGDLSVELKLRYENDSTRRCSISSGIETGNAVNGYAIATSNYGIISVPAGETVEHSIFFDYHDLFLEGIIEIAEFELNFKINTVEYDEENNQSGDVYYTGVLTIQTTLADTYDYDSNSFYSAITDEAILDEYGYTLLFSSEDDIFDIYDLSCVSTAIVEEDGRRSFLFELVNNSDEMITVSCHGDINVDDVMVPSSYFSDEEITVNPGNHGIYRIIFGLNSYEEELWSAAIDFWKLTGTETVHSLEVSFRIEYESNKSNDYAAVTIPCSTETAEANDFGEEIYVDKNIIITMTHATSSEGNAMIAAAVENNGERALDVYLILATLNGEDIDDAVGVGDPGKEHALTYRKETIPAGYRTALAYSIYGEYFDIDEIDSVGFSLEIREENTNSVIKEDNIIYNY